MIKIRNPFAALSEQHQYNCFGCSPHNPSGLHLSFWEDGEQLLAKWEPTALMEGWTGLVHGGIQATLFDELAAWVVLVKMKTSGVTAELNVTYLKPVFRSKGSITVFGRVLNVEKNRATIGLELHDGEGQKCATARAVYFCFPERIARAKYRYPGHDAFYEAADPA